MLGDEVVQLLHPSVPFTLNPETLDGRDPQALIDTWLDQEVSTPFDLNSGLLLRARVLQVTEDQHILLLNHHHIASDGWSVSLLWRDLGAFYNAYRDGNSPDLQPLTVHYQDYAAWQRQHLSGSRLRVLQRHWIEALTGLQPLELPTDNPRPATQSYRGGRLAFAITAAQLQPFEALCRSQGATLQMGLLAVVALLLHRISRQDDLAIAVPSWGRNHPDLEPLIGFFVNTLPIRTRFSPQLSFRQFLDQVKTTSIAAYDHQDLPFERLVEALQPERDRSRNPLAQVMLQLFEGRKPTPLHLAGLEGEPLPASGRNSRFDLEIFLQRSPDESLRGNLSFATDLFHSDRIARLISQLLTLLASATATPDAPAVALNLLPDAELALLESWQQGPRLDLQDLCVHQLFERHVVQTPEAIALIFRDQRLTYAELNTRANQLAQHLIAQGVGPEVIVAVCLERSVELIVALLAILKAGGAYLPLDPAWPHERIQQLLHDGGQPWLLIDAGERSLPRWDRCITLPLHQTRGASASRSVALSPVPEFLPGAQLDCAAYLLFTSGSTGKPKGVLVDHLALTSRCQTLASELDLRPGRRVLGLTTAVFDIAIVELLVSLASGATIVLLPEAQRKDTAAIAALVHADGIDILQATPSVLEALLTAGFKPRADMLLLAGGEPLAPALAQALTASGARLINGYGPTEATIYTTLAAILPGQTVSIGRPIAATLVRVLDRNGQSCPIGMPGELHIGGTGLARGYLNNPQLTAETFIADPGSTDPTSRLYKSGDLASWNPDGTLAFHGRLDQQIKLRGFRIEPGEIEANLLAHPGVAQAAVLLRHDDPANPRLIAYWVPQLPLGQQHHAASSDTVGSGTAPPTALQLRSFLSQRLPDSMVPAAFIALEALPLTPNGKLDRRALPEPSFSGDSEERIAPSTELEHQLHGLWSEVLGHSDFGITDNFFLVGGHSLSSARLTALIEQRLGRRLPLSVLFQQPTLRELSQWLASADPSTADQPDALPFGTAAHAITTRDGRSGFRSLVTLQHQGEAPALFVVHGGNGDVYIHLHLARCLAPHRPVHGLQAVGFDGSAPRHRSVAEMAAHYADEILRCQPSGPHHLLGYSGGGWYAWAVAAELHRRGARPGLIGLVDTGATADLHRRLRLRQLVLRQLRRLPRRARSLGNTDLSRWPGALNRKLQALQFIAWTLLRPRGAIAPEALNPTAVPKPTQPLRGDYFIQLHTYYRPPRLPLRTDVFAANSRMKEHQQLWNFYAQGQAVLHSCLQEHGDYYNADLMPEFAHLLESVLEQIEAG
jgi:amino acid adenylation domain-containing protein